MALEDINVENLKSALITCKNELNHSNSDNLIGTLSSNYWIADSKNNLRQALGTLVNIKYSNLVSKIDHYLNVASMIEEYQNLNNENANKQSTITDLTPKVKKTIYYDSNYTDDNGVVHTEKKSYQTEDEDIKKQISSLTNEINSNKEKMELLKSNIDNAI